MTFGERVKERRLALGMSQEELSMACGYSHRSSINNIELGKNGVPNGKVGIIAKALKCRPEDLLGYEDLGLWEVSESIKINILGTAPCSYDRIPDIVTDEQVEVPQEYIKGKNKDTIYAFRAEGNSMYPRILDGDILLIEARPSVDSGDIAVVGYDDEDLTIKQVKYITGQNWFDLIPFNPEYMTRHIEGDEELSKFRVIGRVFKLIRDF